MYILTCRIGTSCAALERKRAAGTRVLGRPSEEEAIRIGCFYGSTAGSGIGPRETRPLIASSMLMS